MWPGCSSRTRALAGPDDFALASRFLPVSFSTTFDELDDMALGKDYYDINVDYYEGGQDFPEWPRFVRAYREQVEMLPAAVRNFMLAH